MYKCAFVSASTSSTRKSLGNGLTVSILASVSLWVVGGCTAAGGGNYRIERLNKASQQIAEREKRCIEVANKRTDQELASPSNNGWQIQDIREQRSRELSKCETQADHENERVSSSDRAEYESEAQEEGNARATVTRLIASPLSR